MSKQSIQEVNSSNMVMPMGQINEKLEASRKNPTKKQSSDKKRRIVNTRQEMPSGSSENADRKSTHPMVSSPPMNMQKRPLSKTGLIADLHLAKQNDSIIDVKPTDNRRAESGKNVAKAAGHYNYIKSITQNSRHPEDRNYGMPLW